MTYEQYLTTYRLPRSAQSALAWFKSGQAPIGTAIPASLRQYFGGQAVVRQTTPGIDQPLAPTPENLATHPMGAFPAGTFTPPNEGTRAAPLPDPVKPALPTSLSQQTAIDQVLANIRALPSLYNPQQLSLASNTAADLVGQGYFDNATPTADVHPIDMAIPAAERPTAPDITYRIVQGTDGRLYRQAYASITGGAAAHGAGYGSQTEANLAGAQQQLNAARDAILRNYQTSSSGLLTQEGQDLQGYQQDLAGKRAGYAEWQAGQSVPAIAPPARPGITVTPQAPQSPAPLPKPVTTALGTINTGVKTAVSSVLPQIQRLATIKFPPPITYARPDPVPRRRTGFI